jgi:transcriptional repressor NrdR
MVCPFCLHKKTDVFNSRPGNRINTIWRRRRCNACGAQFTTYESADPGSILHIKDGREILPYSHSKLLLELAQICDHRSDIDESVPYLVATIEQKLFKMAGERQELALAKADILSVALETLQRYDPVAYVKYVGKHQKNVSAATLRQALKRAQ